jgi:hypothetical protein
MPDSNSHKAFTVASTRALARRRITKSLKSSDPIQEDAGKNIGNLISHLRHKTKLDYSGFKNTCTENFEGQLQPHGMIAPDQQDALGRLGIFLQTPVAKPIVNGLNSLTRVLLKNKSLQQRLLNTNSPYVLRIVGGRLQA